jgi:hypothetical protein
MSHKIDRREKLVKTWLKLEKCLEEFETEEELKKGKRPMSTFTLTKTMGTNIRPQIGATRAGTAMTRPQTGKNGISRAGASVKKGIRSIFSGSKNQCDRRRR